MNRNDIFFFFSRGELFPSDSPKQADGSYEPGLLSDESLIENIGKNYFEKYFLI